MKPASRPASELRIVPRALATLAMLSSLAANATEIFSETFESGTIDSRVSVTTVGGFASTPGLQPFTDFGSTNAFGFGRSVCGASCFDAHVTGFANDLGSPTLVSSLSFKEIEKFGNWGSGGAIFIDGGLFGTTHYDFGRLPYNDLVADLTYRSRMFDLNRTATTIDLRVRDITSSSEILVDDIVITAVPEPNTVAMFLSGIAFVWFAAKRREYLRDWRSDA